MAGREAWALEQLDSLLEFPVIVSNTPPITRLDNGPLRQGERWWKPTDSGLNGSAGEWTWNGTYWVSPLNKIEWFNSNAVTTTSIPVGMVALPWTGFALLLRGWSVTFFNAATTNNSTDYWEFVLEGQAGMSFLSVGMPTLSTQGDTWSASNRNQIKQAAANLLLSSPTPNNSSNFRSLRISYIKVNNPSNIQAVTFVVDYQRVHP